MIKYTDYAPIHLSANIPSEARKWRNDIRVRRWCRQYSLIDKAQQDRWMTEQSLDPSVKMFGVYIDDKPIGVCGLTSIDLINRNAEFSLYIGADHRGQNYGKQALLTLLKHGFEDWGLNRIWGETYEDNPALKTFLKMGFTQEGRLRMSYFRRGQFIDSILVGILAHEFRKDFLWK